MTALTRREEQSSRPASVVVMERRSALLGAGSSMTGYPRPRPGWYRMLAVRPAGSPFLVF
jgi:hypothetical protein